MPRIDLSVDGWQEADATGRRLAACAIEAVYTSPLRRAIQTARVIASFHGVSPRRLSRAREIHFGEWTGRTFAELEADSRWRLFNEHRATATIPGGETPAAVQQRIIEAVQWLGQRHPGRTVAVVSHGDVIRFALLWCAGMSLDDYARFEVAPASVSELVVSPGHIRIRYINATASSRLVACGR
jgi:probable phosphoglycerate mutase